MKIGFALRRWPVVHRPLQWLNRQARPAIKRLVVNILRVLASGSRTFGPASGFYSDLELLRASPSNGLGRIILTDQGNFPIQPGSPIDICNRRQNRQQPWPAFWIRKKNVRLIGPGLAHVNERKQISVEAAYTAAYAKDDSAYWYCPMGKPVKLEGPWTSIISNWFPVNKNPAYAHWILDALPRLAVLNELPPDTRILVPGQRTKYQDGSLELLGLAGRCRWTTEMHIAVEDYYFLSPLSMVCCYSPYSVKAMRDMFLGRVNLRTPTPKRFYVRRKENFRSLANESDVLEFFTKLGWTILDTADISFADQIVLYANAEAIAVTHGSASSNAIFCSAGCKLVELFCDQYTDGDGEWISRIVGVEYHWAIFPSDYAMNAIVDMNRLRLLMKSAGLL